MDYETEPFDFGESPSDGTIKIITENLNKPKEDKFRNGQEGDSKAKDFGSSPPELLDIHKVRLSERLESYKHELNIKRFQLALLGGFSALILILIIGDSFLSIKYSKETNYTKDIITYVLPLVTFVLGAGISESSNKK